MYKSCVHSLTLLNRHVPLRFIKKSPCEVGIQKGSSTNNILKGYNVRLFHVFRPSKQQFTPKNSIKRIQLMADVKEKWIQLGKYSVFPWSIAGVETCVVVKGENINVAFDMGYSVREPVKCQHVFIR